MLHSVFDSFGKEGNNEVIIRDQFEKKFLNILLTRKIDVRINSR